MGVPLKVAICEDNLDELNFLKKQISLSYYPCEIEAFSSGEELLRVFCPRAYDLVFLDIYLGELLGIEVAATIRSLDPKITLAFVTSSLEHALEGYRVKACAYLEKPVEMQDVHEVLEQALQKRKSTPLIKLLIGGTYQEIPLDSILYLEVQGHAILINTPTKTMRTSQSVKLKELEPLLSKNFLRCHHSYIVNLDYVKSINHELKTFIMSNGDIVHIRYSSFKSVLVAYENMLFEKARRGSLCSK